MTCMAKHRRKHRNCKVLQILCAFSAVLMGCGGGAASSVSGCQTDYEALLTKTEDGYCNPIMYNLFESQVTDWRKECGKSVNPMQKKEVTQKLKDAQACSEKKRQLQMLDSSCADRLSKLSTAKPCIGEECGPVFDKIKKLETDCTADVLEGKYTADIAALVKVFEERTVESDRLRDLQQMMMSCDEVYDIQTQRQARSGLNEIIRQLKTTAKIKEIPEAGTEVERFRKAALESCGLALTAVLEKLSTHSPADLDRIKRVNPRRKRFLRNYKRIQSRLKKVGAPTLFPKAMSPLTAIIDELSLK